GGLLHRQERHRGSGGGGRAGVAGGRAQGQVDHRLTTDQERRQPQRSCRSVQEEGTTDGGGDEQEEERADRGEQAVADDVGDRSRAEHDEREHDGSGDHDEVAQAGFARCRQRGSSPEPGSYVSRVVALASRLVPARLCHEAAWVIPLSGSAIRSTRYQSVCTRCWLKSTTMQPVRRPSEYFTQGFARASLVRRRVSSRLP